MMIKTDKIFDINVLKDKKYKFIKLLMQNGMSVSVNPKTVTHIEKLNDDVGIVRVISENRIFYFNKDEIAIIEMIMYKGEGHVIDYILSDSQKYIIDELTSKKNENVLLFFSTSPVTSIEVNPSEINKIELLDSSNDVGICLETRNTRHLFFLEPILRMEVKHDARSKAQ